MENFITAQKYAALHRISIHSVIKKTLSGELPSFEKTENGKKTIYVQYGDEPSTPKSEPSVITKPFEGEEIDYKKAYEDLHKEYLILKTRYEKLLQESR